MAINGLNVCRSEFEWNRSRTKIRVYIFVKKFLVPETQNTIFIELIKVVKLIFHTFLHTGLKSACRYNPLFLIKKNIYVYILLYIRIYSAKNRRIFLWKRRLISVPYVRQARVKASNLRKWCCLLALELQYICVNMFLNFCWTNRI